MDISTLISDNLNANKGTKRGRDLVERSLRDFGAGRSILIDRDGRVIAGNKTLESAKAAGLDDVVVIQSDGTKIVAVQRTDISLDDPKGRQLAIADNRTAQIGLEWDPEVLGQLASDLNLKPFFTEAELRNIIPANGSGLLTDEDSAPQLPKEPFTKPGDLYILGNHRLLCGDSTNATDIDRLMNGKQADMIWTDPPYNVGYEGKTKDALTIRNDEMSTDSFRQFLYDSFIYMHGVTKDGGSAYVAHADLQGYTFRGAFTDAGWKLSQCLVWKKQTLVMGRNDYHWIHEPILYGWKQGAAHRWHSDRKQTTVLEFDRPNRSVEHPTMKPVALIEYCIRNSSEHGEIVLDPFGGSGSTIIACEASGRNARLMELDPRYCDVIIQRWEAATGQKAIRCQAEDPSQPN